MVDLPIYVWVLVMTGVLAIPATTCANLHSSVVATTDDRAKAGVVTAVAAIGLYGWVVISGALAWAGLFDQDVPWLGIAAVCAFIAILLASRIPLVSEVLADPTAAPRLMEPQSFRTVGTFFLIVLALGKLPTVFAWTAGFGDVAVGLAAPYIATRLRHRMDVRLAIVFNVIGLFDIIAGLAVGYLTSSASGGLLPSVPASSAALDLLPLSLIVTTVVPLAAVLHVISLSKLRAHSRLAVEQVR
jgi:hypothetical protein